MPNERMIETNGVALRVETYGEPEYPALLVADDSASWPAEFCERLAAGRRYVIRYGAGDAGDVLDALGLEGAHLVRRSEPGVTLTSVPGSDTSAIDADSDPVPAILFHTSGGWEAEEDRISTKALAAGDAVGWFDVLYRAGADGSVEMPWSRRHAHPLLVEWADAQHLRGEGRKAIVVGCGLGADAEFISGLGFDTTAFDVSPTAIEVARERHQGSAVHYVAADLLDLPLDWSKAFDLVVEVITVQALPPSLRRRAIDAVTDLVGPGGRLIVISAIHEDEDDSPPWPLNRDDVESFAADGLFAVQIEIVSMPDDPAVRRWRAEFQRL